jgi:hypothetical protein
MEGAPECVARRHVAGRVKVRERGAGGRRSCGRYGATGQIDWRFVKNLR